MLGGEPGLARPMPRPVSPFAAPGASTGKPATPVVGPQYPVNPVRGGVLGVMHKGGKVKKTGKYLLQKGERVVPVSSLLRAK